MNNKKVNQTRKSRGYIWEASVVEKFTTRGFSCTRLGGTTTTMPDVSAHKDDASMIIAIECKSTTSNMAYVPREQLQRCIDWVGQWGLYENKVVILAFKFGRKKSTSGSREKKEFLKLWNFNFRIPELVSCSYEGECKSHQGISQEMLFLEEWQ